jgi:hypothetical protein
MKRGIYILTVMVLLAACKKEPLPDLPEQNLPYYSVKGYLDGEFIDLNVGQEGIHISQGVSEINGIPAFYGQIISPNEDLLLKIEFTRPAKPFGYNSFSAFDLINLGYLVHQPGCLQVSFGNNQLQSNYVQIKGGSGNYMATSEMDFQEYGLHEVSFKFTDFNQNNYSLPINYGYNNTHLIAGFTTAGNGDTTEFFAIDPELEHEWYIDGSLASTEASFGMPLAIGIHKVEHMVKDEYSNESSFTTLVRITDYVLDWQMSINPCSGSSPTLSNYGKVKVSVVKNGMEYSSDHFHGNLSNSFSISGIQYIGSSSDPSRAVFDFNFGSTLVNQNGTDSLSLNAMSGTFNVGL